MRGICQKGLSKAVLYLYLYLILQPIPGLGPIERRRHSVFFFKTCSVRGSAKDEFRLTVLFAWCSVSPPVRAMKTPSNSWESPRPFRCLSETARTVRSTSTAGRIPVGLLEKPSRVCPVPFRRPKQAFGRLDCRVLFVAVSLKASRFPLNSAFFHVVCCPDWGTHLILFPILYSRCEFCFKYGFC